MFSIRSGLSLFVVLYVALTLTTADVGVASTGTLHVRAEETLSPLVAAARATQARVREWPATRVYTNTDLERPQDAVNETVIASDDVAVFTNADLTPVEETTAAADPTLPARGRVSPVTTGPDSPRFRSSLVAAARASRRRMTGRLVKVYTNEDLQALMIR